ncbi:SacI domain protein [Aspergillus melleus]|uniref:SacI domain protein n=1 Tax=Aspergillus melleus TaxID=138277 RepID=UPI001E8ED2FB|nr:uncharacterized protein LDX57_011872 [Aspergillus melleus]KAH8434234.1 hypothetical protein LDX57_011872 [Aspergillus melleus]
MPGLLRKLIIFAAVDGLVIQSPGNGWRYNGNGESSSIKIDYKSGKTSFPASVSDESDRDAALEAYGLVGLLSVASHSFLISITQRQQVAQIHGKPIYAITDVAVIPTSSQIDARQAIAQAKEHLKEETGQDDISSDDLSDAETDGGATDISSVPVSPIRESFHARGQSVNSIAEDVLGKKVRFGRYAANWLSRKTLGLPGLGTVGQDTSEILLGDMKGAGAKRDSPEVSSGNEEQTPTPTPETNVIDYAAPEAPGTSPSVPDPTVGLLPKLLRYTKLLFGSHNFFFAYDHDLTRHVGAQEASRTDHLPLHKAVDELYFWNKHLMTPFIAVDAHSFVLPLIQGFVGQREFTVAATPEHGPEHGVKPDEERTGGVILGEKLEAKLVDTDAQKRDFLLTLISRRSVQRPGLRYLRRGVDDDGNTANYVETEQILSYPDWDPSRSIYSYLQVRGSIPLYFSQSPYTFKPTPVLHHSAETNQFAFERHFRNLSHRYGKIQAVSLIDKQGGEHKLGEQYEKYAKGLNESGGIDGQPHGVEWFDFHTECRGMKFENVSRLVDRLQDTLSDYGDTIVQNQTTVQTQKGIVRTNCMDCLDRTGVAQCAFGQWALERELKHEGIDIDLGGDSSTQWFNTLWADNGDAISKQYSSTAALKGDYTRTRKRDYRGALNDLGLTLSRYYNNIVNDYFSQACIDYLLGYVSTQVFQEFATEMQTADPGISVQKLRQNAIDTSCRIVISDASEEFLGGWAMLTPREPNTLRTLPLEEAVLLLTDAAIYSCRFDWSTDKVVSFERIDLRSITRINHGTYITSILTDAQTDERRNVGLVVEYREGDTHAYRVNTRSLQSSVDSKTLDAPKDTNNEWDVLSWFKGSSHSKTRFIAFKTLPLSNSVMQTHNGNPGVPVSEMAFVQTICEEIERAIWADGSQGEKQDRASLVESEDIVSMEDAKKRTGYLEHLVYDIKKMVWA